MFVLSSLHYLFKPGDIIMFDDFLDPVGEFRAYLDYTQSFKVYPKLISIVKYKGYIDKAAFLL